MQALKSSNHSVVNVSSMKYMLDIRQWLLPHLEDIRYHTEQHIFLFKKTYLIMQPCITKHGHIMSGSLQMKDWSFLRYVHVIFFCNNAVELWT